MNLRNVKIAFIPNEYVDLVRKSQPNRTAFLNIDTLKTILSPSEVDFYVALNSLGVRFEKGVLFSNVLGYDNWNRKTRKVYDMPASAFYNVANPQLELAPRVRERVLDALEGYNDKYSNRQELLTAISEGILPIHILGLEIAYVDATCLFLQFAPWSESKDNRVHRSLSNLYEGLNKTGLFDIGVANKGELIEYHPWHSFCGNLLNELVTFTLKFNGKQLSV